MKNDVLDWLIKLRDFHGIEMLLRKNKQLYMWPGSQAKTLTAADRAFFAEHRDIVKAIVEAGLHPRLPDDYVVGQPPAAKSIPKPESRRPAPEPITPSYDLAELYRSNAGLVRDPFIVGRRKS